MSWGLWGLHTAAEDWTPLVRHSSSLPNVGHCGNNEWGEGLCGHLALAFKNMYPDMKLGMEVGSRHGDINHAWAYGEDGRSHDFMGTHDGSPYKMEGGSDIHLDVDPQDLAESMGIDYDPDEDHCWDNQNTLQAGHLINRHWLGDDSYDADDGYYDPEKAEGRGGTHTAAIEADVAEDLMRLAAADSDGLHPFQKIPVTDQTDLAHLTNVGDHNGRWHFPYLGENPLNTGRSKEHRWGMEPTEIPPGTQVAVDPDGDRKVYYNPDHVTIERSEITGRPRSRSNATALESLQSQVPGTIWRGMSHEEYQNAKRDGYFQTRGDYNLGQQSGTLFTTRPSSAESYSNGYAPAEHKPTFARPAHVIGIPDPGIAPSVGGHEVEVPGRIPFDSVTHHYRGDVWEIATGGYSAYQEPTSPNWPQYNGLQTPPARKRAPTTTVNWVADHPTGHTARTAMPNPLPEGVHFRYHPELQWSPGVTAHQNGKMIGSLEWFDDDHIMVDLGTRKPGEVDRISVDPKHQGNSVASSMFDFAKQHEPRLHHSDRLTEDGRGWSEYEKARHAAVTQNLVDRLHNEFHDWHKENGDVDGVKDWDDDRGPIGDWRNVEGFLSDKYPAANKGFHVGLENVTPLLDHNDNDPTCPVCAGEGEWEDGYGANQMCLGCEGTGETRAAYETGLDAMARHGYDPKEVAAGMLLLHNRSSPLRADMAQEDQTRLNDIFDKRVKMQRDYEQRNARIAGLHGDLPEGITFQHHPAGFDPFPDVIQPNVPVSSSYPTVSAHDGDKMIGHIQWRDDGHPRRDNEIWDLRVHPDYQRRGVATALFDWTTDKINPDLKHSNNLSDEGRAFAEAEDRRPLAEERYEAWRNGQPMPKRFAMAWDEWAPQIQNSAPTQSYHRNNTECPPGGGCEHPEAHARYWIDHGDGNESSLRYRHSRDQFTGRPKLQVENLKTHPDHRNDGLAEALIRRLHDDHPDTPISTGSMSMDGYAFYNRMIEKEPDAKSIITAGRNGNPPPMTFEPFNTMWSNGIMARHADDGRPIAHLHWHPDGEIESIRTHPELQGRDIAKHVLAHAATHPETYEARQGIKPSNNLTNAGRAFARSLGHNPPDEEVKPADDDINNWGWTAVDNYTPMHIPYTGQNEDEMSHHLDKPWTPPERTANTHGDSWPAWWRNRTHPNVPWDKRWHPNHPQHVPGPWDN